MSFNDDFNIVLFDREKKKEKLNSLLGRADQLERFNNELRQECYRLEAEKRYLVKVLMDRAQDTDTSTSYLADSGAAGCAGYTTATAEEVQNVLWSSASDVEATSNM